MNRCLFILGTFLGILLTTSVCACTNSSIDQFLLFGNSLFDTGAGNAIAESKGLPILPSGTPPFFIGRHSNGPIWIDYTRAALQIGYKNFAVTGAQTGLGNFLDARLGGLFQQVERFAEQYSKVDSKTLVIMEGGGNDFFSLLNTPGNLNPAGVAATTAQAISNLEHLFSELQALGSKKIVMWNLGDMGKLPLFTDPAFGLTALSPLFSAASAGFNNALQKLIQTFNNYSNHQKQIYLLDTFALFNELTQKLIAERVDATKHTISTLPGGKHVVSGPQPDRLEFYDQVHPTSFAWGLFSNSVSAFLDTLINGPRFVAAEQDLVFATSSAHRDTVDNHLRTLHAQKYVYGNRWEDCCFCESDCFQFYADINSKWGSTATRTTAFGLHYHTQLAQLGVDYCLNECTTIGCSLTAQASSAHLPHCCGHIKLNEYVPTLYATFMWETYFIDLSSSYHFLNFRKIDRNIPFLQRTAKGHMHGEAFEANTQFGYVSQRGCLTFIPIMGLGFENICLKRYTEKGAGFLDLKLRRQHQNSLISKIGAQLFWNGLGGCFIPFGELYYEYEFLRNRHTIGPRLYKSNDNSIDFSRVDCGKRNWLKYAVGFEIILTECWSGNISYEGETTFKNCNNSIRAQIDAQF